MYHTIINGEINVKRLHGVRRIIEADGPGQPLSLRGEGFTTAYMLDMLWEALVGPPDAKYLYVGENRNATDHMRADFCAITADMGLQVTTNRFVTKLFIPNSPSFRYFEFLPCNDQLDRLVRGQFYQKLFIDVMEDTYWRFHEQMAVVRYHERPQHRVTKNDTGHTTHEQGTIGEDRSSGWQMSLFKLWSDHTRRETCD